MSWLGSSLTCIIMDCFSRAFFLPYPANMHNLIVSLQYRTPCSIFFLDQLEGGEVWMYYDGLEGMKTHSTCNWEKFILPAVSASCHFSLTASYPEDSRVRADSRVTGSDYHLGFPQFLGVLQRNKDAVCCMLHFYDRLRHLALCQDKTYYQSTSSKLGAPPKHFVEFAPKPGSSPLFNVILHTVIIVCPM